VVLPMYSLFGISRELGLRSRTFFIVPSACVTSRASWRHRDPRQVGVLSASDIQGPECWVRMVGTDVLAYRACNVYLPRACETLLVGECWAHGQSTQGGFLDRPALACFGVSPELLEAIVSGARGAVYCMRGGRVGVAGMPKGAAVGDLRVVTRWKRPSRGFRTLSLMEKS